MTDFITHDPEGILLSPSEFAEANNLEEFDLRPYVELLARDHASLTILVKHAVTVLNTISQSINAACEANGEGETDV